MENKIQIPEIVRTIASVLKNNGNQAFVVGGAVRDAVMGDDCKDIDIATDLFVDDVIKLFKKLEFVTEIKKTGDKFPVARIFTTCNNEFEIATFRADISEKPYNLDDFLILLKNTDANKYKKFTKALEMK